MAFHSFNNSFPLSPTPSPHTRTHHQQPRHELPAALRLLRHQLRAEGGQELQHRSKLGGRPWAVGWATRSEAAAEGRRGGCKGKQENGDTRHSAKRGWGHAAGSQGP